MWGALKRPQFRGQVPCALAFRRHHPVPSKSRSGGLESLRLSKSRCPGCDGSAQPPCRVDGQEPAHASREVALGK